VPPISKKFGFRINSPAHPVALGYEDGNLIPADTLSQRPSLTKRIAGSVDVTGLVYETQWLPEYCKGRCFPVLKVADRILGGHSVWEGAA
jgi:hypothetical protein